MKIPLCARTDSWRQGATLTAGSSEVRLPVETPVSGPADVARLIVRQIHPVIFIVSFHGVPVAVLHDLVLRDVRGSLHEFSKPVGALELGDGLPGFALRTPAELAQVLQCFASLFVSLGNELFFRQKLHFRPEKSFPEPCVSGGLERGGDEGVPEEEESETEARHLVVARQYYADQAHRLHGPLDEVDSARVGGGAHPIHDGEAEDTSTKDVADHPVEILISQVVLEIVPGGGDEIQGQTVQQSDPREERHPHFPLDEVGEYEDRQDDPGADPRSKVEKWIPAKVWGREESKYPNEGEYKHHVIDLFGQQRHGVLVGGLHRNTSVLEGTKLELFAPPGELGVEPGGLALLVQVVNTCQVRSDVHLVIRGGQVQLEGGGRPELAEGGRTALVTEVPNVVIVGGIDSGRIASVNKLVDSTERYPGFVHVFRHHLGISLCFHK